MNKKSASFKKIIMTVTLVVMIMLCTFMEFLHMNSTTAEECWNMLDEVASYADYGMNTMFSGNVIALSNMCTQISKFDDSKGPQVVGIVKNTTAGVTKSAVRIYYADGDILTGGGFLKRTDDMPDFSYYVSQGPKIISLHNDPLYPSNKIIEHVMPIVKEGEVIGVVSVIVQPESIDSFIPIYGFDGKADFFVIDKKTGDIVIDNYNKLGSNLYDNKSDNVKGTRNYSWDAWIEDIKIGKNSDITITGPDFEKNQYIHTKQSFNHDWVIAVVADSDVVFARVYILRVSFVIVLCFELVIFLIYLFWLLKTTGKEIKSEAEHGNNVIQTLASDYEVVFVGDLANDEAKIIRMSNRLRKIINSIDINLDVSEEGSFSKRMSIIANSLVHPEERQMFLYNTIGEGLAERVKSGSSFSFEFRAGLNGKYRHYTIKAVPNRAESEASVVLGFRDIDKEYKIRVAAEEEEARKRLLLEEAKNYSVVAGLSDDFDYVAHINYRTEEVTRYRINDRFKKLADSVDDNVPSYERFRQCIDKVLYEEDYDSIMSQIERDNVVRILKKDKVLRLECRLVFDEKIEYYRVKYVCDSKDPDSVIVGVLNIDFLVESERKQKEQEILLQNTELLRALSDQFEVVYDVDIESGEYEEITKEGFYSKAVSPNLYIAKDFFEDVVINTREMLYEDDVEEALIKTSREYILKTLEKEPFEEWNYRIKSQDGFVWYRMRIAYKDSSKKHVIFGLFNINDRVMQKEAIRLYEQDALFYQRAILDNAYSYFKVNLTQDKVISRIIERVNGEPEDYTDKYGSELPAYNEIVRVSAEKYVHDEFKSSYIEELSADRLIERFNAGELMPEYTCMIWSSMLGLHFRKYVNYMTKDEVTGDVLSMVVAYDVTAEKQKEIEQHQYIEQIMSLSEDFESIYDVDIDTGLYSESVKNGYFAEPILNEMEKDSDYFVTQSRVINRFVYGEDKKKMSFTMSREGILRKLAVDEAFHLDFRLVFESRIVWYRMRVTKIGDWSRERRILIGMINNDENMKKEKEHQETLEKALEMANSANRAKTTFLNSMSHDIRTPMNAIIGFTGLAESHIDNKEKVYDYLEKINQSSEHLLALINDVLDMSRIESGQVFLNEKEESIAEIIHSLKSIIVADVNAKKLNLCIDAMTVKNEKVICDKLRLNQVLLNLVSNAIKYTNEDGNILIKVSQVKCEKEGYASFVFTVKDNGMGMSEEYVKTIFDPFTRENSATVSGIQGTGLGMSISKNIVDLMGGDISVKSTKGVGTEFTLALDMKTDEEGEPFEKIPEFVGSRMLLLSNDEGVQSVVPSILEKTGAKPECFVQCEKAYSAVEKASEEGKPYSVILTDWHVNDKGCKENVENLISASKEKSSILVLSVCDLVDNEEEVEALNIDGHVNKPMFPSDIYNAIKKIVYRETEEKTETSDERDYSKKKILLVEDNDLNREIACELLKEMGLDTESAEDGSVAVSMFEEYDIHKFDMVLMDIQMPEMDGYEATRRIRTLENGRFADIPIVAMTANAFEEDKKNAIDSGMNDHLAKPIDVNVLRDMLNKYL